MYSYDTCGNIKTYSEKSGDSVILQETYTYNGKGQVTGINYSGLVSRKNSFTYQGSALDYLTSMSTGNYKIMPTQDIDERYTGKSVYVSGKLVDSETVEYVKYTDHATHMPAKIQYKNSTGISYSYDSDGNIAQILKNGVMQVRYTYDKLNRLIREDNRTLGESYFYSYDNNGNILSKEKCSYTTGSHTLGTGTVSSYTYNQGKMTMFGAQNCTYDPLGNPTTYRGNTLAWTRGKKLVSYNDIKFEYDAQGRRYLKYDTNSGVYFTHDSQGRIIKQSNGLEFFYDITGIVGVKYNNINYVYRKDLLGNIIAILDNNGKIVVQYEYDAWGNHTVSGSNVLLGNLNPFRYRSYYYDTETKLYFLQTRYYDPEVGRFINMDSIEYADPETINGLNLYSYCYNDPINYYDPSGHFPILALVLGLIALVGLGLTIGGVASDNNVLTAVGLTMIAIPAFISGGMAIVGGLATGATLTAVTGTVTFLAGAGCSLFASAEYQQAITGNNWMLDAGMSEELYNGLLLTTAVIATFGTFASSFCYNFNIKSIEGIGKFGKYGGKGFNGIKFKIGGGKTHVLTFHTHSHVTGKGISQWHWQLQKWNPYANEAASTISKWIWWNLIEL